MVSLSRLLSAADDVPLDERSLPSTSQLPRDCVLPPSVTVDSIPPTLRRSLEGQSSSLGSHPAVSVSLPLLLKDLGPEATAPRSMSTLAGALAHFGRPSEDAVASALLFLTASSPQDSSEESQTMFHLFSLFCSNPENPSQDPSLLQAMNSNPSSPSEWNIEVFVKAVSAVANQHNAPLDWRRIILFLDIDGLHSRLTQAGFIEIAKAYMTGTGGLRLSADCLVGNWRHPSSQVCMLGFALASPNLVDWNVLEGFEGATSEDLISPYSRVLLVEKLVELDAPVLLQQGIKHKSDVLLLSLACAKPKNNASLQQKLTVSLLTSLFSVFPTSEKCLRQMWNVTPALVEAGIISMWKKDPSMLHKAFSISMDLQILPELLSTGTSLEFSLELAMLAYRKDVLNLESWLSELLATRGLPVVSPCTLFLAQKLRSADMIAAAQLSLDAVRIIFRCLLSAIRNAGAAQAQEVMDGLREVVDAYCRLNPRISDLSPAYDIGDRTVLVGTDVNTIPSSAGISDGQNIIAVPSSDSEIAPDAASTAAAMLYPLSSEPDGAPIGFPDEIDKEADVFFQRLYRGDIATDQAVEILRTLKNSQSVRERQVFDCAMHTLFDEYRFFMKYPDRELRITGMLFGSVIFHGLISGTILGLAIRCVLDALRTVEPAPQPIGRYAKFGLCALERFRGRLYEWPQYCSLILEMPRLQEYAPELIAEVRKSLQLSASSSAPSDSKQYTIASESDTTGQPLASSEDPAPSISNFPEPLEPSSNVTSLLASPTISSSTTPVKPSMSSSSLRASPSVGVDGALGLSALNLTELLGLTSDEAKRVVAPDEATQDKIKFIFNNLSSATMDVKVKEMLSILRPEHLRFFSVYIVVKRASSESNFHYLYLTLLDRIDTKLPNLFPVILDTSYRRVRVLLLGDKSKTTSTDRLVLKSLGSWIGSITIARNKPIIKRDLDLKELLMDAYSNGRLTTVVPFVSKVLEACPRSLIFKPTQPWIRCVLSLMKEIYCVDDLKLNMKFELQLLCKTLNIDVTDITPSNLLRDRPAPDKTHNPDFNTKRHASSSPLRTSPSPTASPSPEIRPHYQPTGRSNVPVFTLSEAQTVSASHPISLASGQAPPTTRLDVNPSLMASTMAMGGEMVNELSGLLSNTSITSTIATNAMQRNTLHAPASMGIASATAVNPTQRAVAALNPNDTLFPNIHQYVQVSNSLLQTNPNLKRLIPFAIDRAIREIIQPVVERSCAIAFLTTKELTLKDFANEPDIGKVRRAALQMVQQLAGSLALVTSKEPLRVSMGNQLRIVLTPTVSTDQTLIDQAAQGLCAANLDLGCAIIERHAKEKSACDLAEKIGSAFTNRRPQHSAYALGMIPGPEVHRTYDDFSRLHRLTSPQNQYEPVHSSSSSLHALHQSQVAPVAAPQTSIPMQTHLQRPIHFPEHRVNGAIPDLTVDGRLSQAQILGQNHVSSHARQVGENERALEPGNDSVIGSRRANPPQISDSPIAIAVYGTALPVMASPTSVAAAILAAAGSSNSSGASHSQALASGSSGGAAVPGEEALSTQQVLEKFNTVYPHITSLISETVTSSKPNALLCDLPVDHDLHSLWTQIPGAVKRSVTADEAGMAVAQKIFKRLFEGDSNLYREVHVNILDGLRESCRRLPKELSSWLAFSEEWKKLHKECIIALLKTGSLLNITAYDELLAKMIDNGRNVTALDFAGYLVHRAVVEEPLATAAELYMTLETMAKVGRRSNPPNVPSCPEGLTKLVEAARNVVHKTIASAPLGSNPSSGMHDGTSMNLKRDGEPSDPAGARELIAGLLLEWQRILASDNPTRPVPDHIVASFLNQIRTGMLINEDSRERFFRITIELVSTVTRAALQSRDGIPPVASDLLQAPYTIVETTVRLIGSLCRPELGSSGNDSQVRDMGMLCQFLSALVKDILKNTGISDLRPHFRLFSGLIVELAVGSKVKETTNIGFSNLSPSYFSGNVADGLEKVVSRTDALHFLADNSSGYAAFVRHSYGFVLDENGHGKGVNLDNVQVVCALVGALSACSPTSAPNFVFSWLQLISNKDLMPSLLSLSTNYGWPLFRHLMLRMVSYLSMFLTEPRQAMSNGVRTLYGGLLRVLLVLLHDFPEFLCAYHMDLCDVIPSVCVQLRNLVLASFPKDMRLPDPFLPDLNVEDLPDMLQQPLIMSDYLKHITGNGVREMLDNHLMQGNGNGIGGLDLDRLLKNNNGSERVNDVKRIWSIVMYVGQYAIGRNGDGGRLGGNASKFLRILTRELDAEGRHHLLNGIANQLRYPNNNTMYYSRLVLILFHEAQDDTVKEQITRVLVERLIANRPHPWGLLVTFVQLIKNSEYNFWGHGFVRCAPEIEQLFENVAKFCVGPALQYKPQSLLAAT